MEHDVFISYSSIDKPTADAVCAVLESQGIRCWIAPRDIIPGKEWGAAIIEAIKGARLMVLVFSGHANDSPQINREVERAVNRGIPIIPLRIEDVAPTESLEYFISTPHWLDAFTPPLEQHLQYLAHVSQQILQGPSIAAGAAPPPRAMPQPKPQQVTPEPPVKPGKKPVPLVGAVVFSIALLLLAGWWFGLERPRREREGQPVATRPAAEAKTAKPIIRVVPDQYGTIQSAIDGAKPGDTVKVKTGVYTESVHLVEGINLIGEGRDMVRIRTSSTTNALNGDGIKKGFVSGLTLEHADKSGNSLYRHFVVSLCNGCSIELTECRIQSGDGNGIGVRNASPRISECILQENGWNGIRVMGTNANPQIVHNQFRDNTESGIEFQEGAGGEARQNACEHNKQCGIVLHDAGAGATLIANLCNANGLVGIGFDRNASGEAQENICDNNNTGGIIVADRGTTATLKANRCRGNQGDGIRFWRGAAGTAQGNICENNSSCGIQIFSATTAVLNANQCRSNNLAGIRFSGSTASGEAVRNLCEKNKGSGIEVLGPSCSPLIVANTCRENGRWGIWSDFRSNPVLTNNLPYPNQRGFLGSSEPSERSQ